MQYIKKDCGSFNLHIIKTTKFKTINLEIMLRNKLKKEDITKTNFLTDILVYSNAKYKKRNELTKAAYDLYSAVVGAGCRRIGKYYVTGIQLNFLNEKYSEKGMLDKSLEFIKEIIFEPNVENNKFDETSFNIVKENTKKTIESIKENTRKYSMIRLFENMDKDMPYSYHGFGYLEDLEKITRENLYEYYQEFISKSSIDIFIIGDVDISSCENIIREKFKFRTFKRPVEDTIINHLKFRKTPKKITEEEKIAQSKLAIGLKIEKLNSFERNYVLTIYNSILGGGSNSKLFEDVREKNSLCYNIFSSCYKPDNILLISSGIARKNADKAIKIIKKDLKEMEKGLFTEEQIEKAKSKYINSLNQTLENPLAITSSYYAMELMGIDDIETRKKEILKVTYKDIKELSKKIHLDTIYLLGGEDNDE